GSGRTCDQRGEGGGTSFGINVGFSVKCLFWTRVVAETVWKLFAKVQTEASDIVDVSTITREYPQRFGKAEFILPEFNAINKAAYWNYQRSRVYIRTHHGLPKVNGPRVTWKIGVVPNKIVRLDESRPELCPLCGFTKVYKWGTYSQTVYDLRFTKAGIKRWVVRYIFHRFACWHCKRPFQLYSHQPKYGTALYAYILYQLLEMAIPQNAIATNLWRLFGLPFCGSGVNHLKANIAEKYREAYEAILARIVSGQLIHVDETKATVNGKDRYVWVLTSLVDIAFVYRTTREVEFLREMLKPFTGVLVSDFYSGYDAIP